jgi:hypothetical protein
MLRAQHEHYNMFRGASRRTKRPSFFEFDADQFGGLLR